MESKNLLLYVPIVSLLSHTDSKTPQTVNEKCDFLLFFSDAETGL